MSHFLPRECLAEYLLKHTPQQLTGFERAKLEEHTAWCENNKDEAARLRALKGKDVHLATTRRTFGGKIMLKGTRFTVREHFCGHVIATHEDNLYSLRARWVKEAPNGKSEKDHH